MAKTIELAENSRVKGLGEQIDMILAAMGHPEALVTDESTIWDFYFSENLALKAKELSSQLGVPVKESDFIYQIAERLKENSLIFQSEENDAEDETDG